MSYSFFNRLALASATAGLTIATVLTVSHDSKTPLPCGTGHGCEQVAQDSSSMFMGHPVSGYGMAAYAVLIVCSILRIKGIGLRPASFMGLIVSLLGVAGSVVLTYIAITKIHATCIWCLGSAAMMVISTVCYLATPKASEGIPDDAKPVSALPWGVLPMLIISAYAVFGHVVKEIPPDMSSVHFQHASLDALESTSHPLGSKGAPVTIVEFGDLLCPACQTMHQRLLRFLIRNHGLARVLYHVYPLKNLQGHEDSEYAATLVEQLNPDDFWGFVGDVYGLDQKPTRADFDRIFANYHGKHIRDPKLASDAVKQDLKIGQDYGVKITPTYILFIERKPVAVASSVDLQDVIRGPQFAKIFTAAPKPKSSVGSVGH